MLRFFVFLILLVGISACQDETLQQATWQPVDSRIERDQLLAQIDSTVGSQFLQKAYADPPLKLLSYSHDLDFDNEPELFLRLEHPEVCQEKTLCPMAMFLPMADGYELSNFFHGHALAIGPSYNERLTFVVDAYRKQDVFRWVFGEYGGGYSADAIEVDR